MNRRTAECRTAEPQKYILFLLLAFYFSLEASSASAQVGNCEPALAEAVLDAGNVRASIYNNGALFWRGGAPLYEVPKGLGANSIFSAGIWIGGKINGEVRTAASRYGPWEFWAGPLDAAGNPPADCAVYDNIWEIRTEDIDAYINAGEISENLQNWPWELGAPVVDGDGNPDNYNLAGGDLPALLGDQRLWWIMNDRGNVHEASDSEPIGLEVHASAFAFDNPGTLGNFTFYDYKIINKNTAPLTDTFFSLFSDVDLGDFDDDYVGSDSLLNVGYVYNSDNIDRGCGVGVIPPAVGFSFIETIPAKPDGLDNDRDGEVDEAGEMLGASSVLSNVEPHTKAKYYNVMNGRWEDGRPLLKGGNGREGWGWPNGLLMEPTKFAFSGNPVDNSFWSEVNRDGLETPNRTGDRNLVTTTGAFDIASGDTVDVRIAVVWSQGRDNINSVELFQKDVTGVQNAGSALFQSRQIADKEESPTTEPVYTLDFSSNFPNPFSKSTTFRYSLPQSMRVRLHVYDALGREVKQLVNQEQGAGIYSVDFNAGTLPSGIYMARIEMDNLSFTKRLVLTR